MTVAKLNTTAEHNIVRDLFSTCLKYFLKPPKS